jgi:hypothetical protein
MVSINILTQLKSVIYFWVYEPQMDRLFLKFPEKKIREINIASEN